MRGEFPPMDSDTFTPPTFDSDTDVTPPPVDFGFGHGHGHRPPIDSDTFTPPTFDSDTSDAPSLADAPMVPWFARDDHFDAPDFVGGDLNDILNDDNGSTDLKGAGSSFDTIFGFGNFRPDFANDNQQSGHRQRDRR